MLNSLVWPKMKENLIRDLNAEMATIPTLVGSMGGIQAH